MKLAVAMLAAVVVGGSAGWVTSVQERFDQADWYRTSATSGGRLSMADHLVRSREIIGLTPTQVVELLGDPTPTDKWEDWDMIYILGPCRCLFPIDYEWLVIRFDDGRATQARIVQD